MAGIDQLKGIMDLVSMVKGTEGTTATQTASGGSSTQQTQLSDEAVNEQIKRILAGAGGVKDIGQAARRSGLYNATTEEMLLGNLYATAAAQGEIARAPIVKTVTPTTTVTETSGQAGMKLTDALLPVLGMAALSKGFDYFLGSGSSDSSAVSGVTNTVTRAKKSLDNDPLLGGTDFNFGLSPDLISFGGSAGSGGWNLNIADAANQAGGFQGATKSSTPGSHAGLKLRGQEDDGFDLGSAISTGLGSLFGGSGLGGIASAVTGGLGLGGSGGGRTSGGSVICTALQELGELDAELYAKGTAYLEQLPQEVVVGYHSWAINVANKIRNGNKALLVICRPFARSRTGLLSTNGTFWDHLKYPLGTLTKFVGEPICGMIGKRILRKVAHA